MSMAQSQLYDKALGALLRTLRLRHRVKQAELAERLGVDVTLISHFERGQRAMNASMLLRIADLFGVPAAQLLPSPHQGPAVATPVATPVRLDPDLSSLEAAALQSLVNLLEANPTLLPAVMEFAETRALPTEAG